MIIMPQLGGHPFSSVRALSFTAFSGVCIIAWRCVKTEPPVFNDNTFKKNDVAERHRSPDGTALARLHSYSVDERINFCV